MRASLKYIKSYYVQLDFRSQTKHTVLSVLLFILYILVLSIQNRISISQFGTDVTWIWWYMQHFEYTGCCKIIINILCVVEILTHFSNMISDVTSLFQHRGVEWLSDNWFMDPLKNKNKLKNVSTVFHIICFDNNSIQTGVRQSRPFGNTTLWSTLKIFPTREREREKSHLLHWKK